MTVLAGWEGSDSGREGNVDVSFSAPQEPGNFVAEEGSIKGGLTTDDLGHRRLTYVCPYETDDWYDSQYVCGWDSSYIGYYTDPNWYAMDGYITTTDMYGGWSSTIPTQLGM